jgi:hypothetical protein
MFERLKINPVWVAMRILKGILYVAVLAAVTTAQGRLPRFEVDVRFVSLDIGVFEANHRVYGWTRLRGHADSDDRPREAVYAG